MSARLKDGWQVCPQCGGRKGGCWGCQKSGFRILCPICANSSNDLFSVKKLEDGEASEIVLCGLCGGTFDYSGKILSAGE